MNITYGKLPCLDITKLLHRASCLLGLMLVLSASAFAQYNSTTTSLTDSHTPTAIAPGTPAGSYALSGFDNINLFNGHLNFSLPLLNVGGRGEAGYTITLPIEQTWRVKSTKSYSQPPGGFTTVPVTYQYYPEYNSWDGIKPGYSPGVLQGRNARDRSPDPYASIPADRSCATLTRLTFTTSNGTEYELRDQLTDGAPHGSVEGETFSRGSVFVSRDGSSMTFISDSPIKDMSCIDTSYAAMNGLNMIYPSGYLLFPNGTRYRFDSGKVTWIRDRNGNQISFTSTSVTDSLNRVVTFGGGVTFKGFGGAQRTISVNYSPLSQALRSDVSGVKTYYQLFPLNNSSTNTASTFNPSVVSSVTLPGGRSYTFKYNEYGELARVELPTGGTFEYDYEAGSTYHPSGIISTTGGYAIYRRVLRKRIYTESSPGASPESTIEFKVASGGAIEESQYAGSNTTDTPLALSRHYFYGSPLNSFNSSDWYPNWDEGREYKTEILDPTGGNALRVIANVWKNHTSPRPFDPYIEQTSTTLSDTNQVSKQVYAYDQYNNRTDVWEFDFGQGAAPTYAVRHTHTDYLTTNTVNGTAYNYDTLNPNVTSVNLDSTVYLRILPKEQFIYEVNAASGAETLKANTRYSFDQSPVTPRFNISGQCTRIVPNTSPVQCDNVSPEGYMTRGNLTRASVWRNTDGVWLNTDSEYDVAGNVMKIKDARGYATTVDFADRYGSPDGEARFNATPAELGAQVSYALPTSVTNALGHIIYAQYDYYLGSVVDGEDANGVVSSGYYNDPLDRPTQVIRAIGTPVKSRSTFSYNDTSRIITSTTDQNAYGDDLFKSETFYDGLGRTTETRQYESASAYIVTKRHYDALGRANQTSNPYRPSQSETALYTTSIYDMLGRVTSMTTPDSAAVVTSYSGNTVTVTDQAGKSRRSTTDALGRLINVVEDPSGSFAYQTTYGYDVLDNLLTVSQGGQARNFSYDSLKRLTSATNPESGTISHQYDAAGNLVQKTDARAVVTTYSYDALNRAKTRSYNDGTPAVTYTYDAAGIAYAKGKLTSVSSSVSATSYTGFDALGRITGNQQVTNAQTYSLSYGYNLAGALTTRTYPSGRTITNGYDTAGRLSTVNGQKTGEPAKTYASQFTYASHGAVQGLTLGNSLTEQVVFNSRLQPLLIKLATTSNLSVEELHYYYGGADNNGNVLHHTSVVDGMARQQVYDYDQLNRVKKGSEVNQSNGALHWQQAFIYDRFGNRNFDVAQTTPAMLGSNLAVDQTTNRYASGQGSILYDAAGNVKRDFDGHTFAYDGENHQTSYDAGTASYSYDGDGRRVKKVSGSATTIFVYDAMGQLIAEYSTSTPQGSGGTSYLTSDSLGTPRVITDTNGAVKSRHDYLPFGEEISVGVGGRTVGQKYVFGVGDDGVRQKFTGYERDSETGLDYAQARYYSNVQGRFTSADPLLSSGIANDPQSWNRYSYTLNNPLNLIDPDGKLTRTDDYRTSRNGSISTELTNDSFDRFYVEDSNGNYNLEAQLERNADGLVQFPDEGTGFVRYGQVDRGGFDRTVGENVGTGDHFLQPQAAAALFGLANVLNSNYGFTLALGDMSSSNGSDPWQPGSIHHTGHGHLENRSGLDIDFRYLNTEGVSFQSRTATTDSQFSGANNQIVFDTAVTFGLTVNYQGTRGVALVGPTRNSLHNDHGHIGLRTPGFVP